MGRHQGSVCQGISGLQARNVMQAQFRTGQTEGLLPVIVVREHSGSIPPLPVFSLDDYEDQT